MYMSRMTDYTSSWYRREAYTQTYRKSPHLSVFVAFVLSAVLIFKD